MSVRTWIAAAPLVAAPWPAQAHAFAQRYDLPLPLWLYLVGAGATVAVSFVIVVLFVGRRADTLPEPRLDSLQTPVGRLLAHPIVLGLIRIVSVTAFLLLILAGLFGTQDDAFDNILPTAVWVIWWVGLAFVSALVGDVWALVNPWRITAEWVRRIWPSAARRDDVPTHGAVWPAVGLFLGFAWAELVWPDRAVPASLASGILIYSAVTWLGMYTWGIEPWLRRGEIFSVLFGLFARFAPTELRVASRGSADHGAIVDAGRFRMADPLDRRLCLRPYTVGLLTTTVPHLSVLFFVLLALSTVSFDGFAETPAWQSISQATIAIPFISELPNAIGFDNASGILKTAGIITTPVVFFVFYLAFCWIMARLVPPGHISSFDGAPVIWTALSVARAFVLTLVPIAIAYHLAHFISLLLIFGQQIIPLASDPFGYGWDLFGTADYKIDIAIVGAQFVWFFSIAAIVVGHIAAVYLGHVMALRVFGDAQVARRSQYPLLVLMIAYTMLSLWILAQPIVEGTAALSGPTVSDVAKVVMPGK